jgi:hypothetical protein
MQFATPPARGQQVYCSQIFQNGSVNSAANVEHLLVMWDFWWTKWYWDSFLSDYSFLPLSLQFSRFTATTFTRYLTTPVISQPGSTVPSYTGKPLQTYPAIPTLCYPIIPVPGRDTTRDLILHHLTHDSLKHGCQTPQPARLCYAVPRHIPKLCLT